MSFLVFNDPTLAIVDFATTVDATNSRLGSNAKESAMQLRNPYWQKNAIFMGYIVANGRDGTIVADDMFAGVFVLNSKVRVRKVSVSSCSASINTPLLDYYESKQAEFSVEVTTEKKLHACGKRH